MTNSARRSFLAQATRLAGLSALALAWPGTALSRAANYPFQLGIASGSPRPTSVVLWTRLCIDPVGTEAFAPFAAAVRWEVANDPQFQQIVAKGSATALPELAHSVHVDVTGLAPDRWYFYRFMLGDAVSPTGRTRTAPAQDAQVAALRFAFASCQHWEFGQYAAHRHIVAADPELVVFLGDYIYEWGPYDTAHPQKARAHTNPLSRESLNLQDYRRRYAQYKSDPAMQAAHEVAPWIVTWDDHEVANDYGNDRDERLDPNFILRRGAAYQAFYEHMPIRLPAMASGPNQFATMRMYDRYDWGRLARFDVLDDRQYRAYHACPTPGRGGSSTVTSACTERVDPARSLLGREQEAWLDDGMAKSPAQWNILTQQTLMAQISREPIKSMGEGKFWTDGWDGYPAARTRLLESIARHKPANPLVISGDVHTFYAADLRRDFDAPTSAANPLLATEFCGGSVTSSSRAQSLTDKYVDYNPHINFGCSDKRGYVLMELTAKQARTRFMALDDVGLADSPVKELVGFTVEDGRPGLQRT